MYIKESRYTEFWIGDVLKYNSCAEIAWTASSITGKHDVTPACLKFWKSVQAGIAILLN